MRDAAIAAIVLAFDVGVMLGIGVVTTQWFLVISSGALLFAILYYFHRLAKEKS